VCKSERRHAPTGPGAHERSRSEPAVSARPVGQTWLVVRSGRYPPQATKSSYWPFLTKRGERFVARSRAARAGRALSCAHIHSSVRHRWAGRAPGQATRAASPTEGDSWAVLDAK